MKRKYLTLLMFFLLLACVPEDHVLEIEIINNTAEPVKDLKVITAGGKVSFEADNLPAGQKIGHTLNISGNSADGEFTSRFSRSGGEEVSSSGSYLEEGWRLSQKYSDIQYSATGGEGRTEGTGHQLIREF